MPGTSRLLGVFTLLAWAMSAAVPGPARAESDEMRRTSVFVELLGNGIFPSVNLDYRFSPHATLRAGPGVGASFSPWDEDEGAAALVNLMVKHLSGHGDGHLELGIGVTASARAALTATVGYRYQPLRGGFLFRAGFTPVYLPGEGFLPWAGVSFGYTF